MTRSGYTDDEHDWGFIRWRGAVNSALRGRRGQAFLSEMLVALDALPAPRLIKGDIVKHGECCGMGAVALKRGMDVARIDPDDPDTVAARFDLSVAMARELAFINDEAGLTGETPEQRFIRVRAWVVQQLKPKGD